MKGICVFWTIVILAFIYSSTDLDRSGLANLDIDILIENEFKTRASRLELLKYMMSNASGKAKLLSKFKEKNKEVVAALKERVSGSLAILSSKNNDELTAVSKAASASISITSPSGEKHVVTPVISSIVKSSDMPGKVVYDMKKTLNQVPADLRPEVIKELSSPLQSATASMAASLSEK